MTLRVVIRTLPDGATELLLREGEGPEMVEVRAQHRVMREARERLISAAVGCGFDEARVRALVNPA